jgi:hypothetical protein
VSRNRGLSAHNTKIVSGFPLNFEEPAKEAARLTGCP